MENQIQPKEYKIEKKHPSKYKNRYINGKNTLKYDQTYNYKKNNPNDSNNEFDYYSVFKNGDYYRSYYQQES